MQDRRYREQQDEAYPAPQREESDLRDQLDRTVNLYHVELSCD